MAIFMKFGDTVKGQVTTEGFKDWIELTAFEFQAQRAVSDGSGGRQREGSNPRITDIVISKPFDKASAQLYQDSIAGTFKTKVDLKLSTTSKNKMETYLHYELTDCGVSSYGLGSDGDNPRETITLNFTKVMVTPSPLDTSGSPVKGAVVTYDLLKQTAS